MSFKTIYTGWYPGRTPHIHVKVHVGGPTVHTGQLFFDDKVTDVAYARPPYNARSGRRTTNDGDDIYARGGRESTLGLTPEGDGYVGTITLGVDTSGAASAA